MSFSLVEYLSMISKQPAALAVFFLTIGVLLVNGWTDAPNSIAGAVATGALPFRPAVLLAAISNFLGVLCVTAVTTSVAETIYSIAYFSGGSHAALIALCAAMTAIILWASCACYFGIPTSESHALIAGISGAAIGLEGSFSCIRWSGWSKVLIGLVLSTVVGFFAGRVAMQLTKRLRWTPRQLRLAQIPGAMFSAALHGAQDGQKFIGIFILATALAQGRNDIASFPVPIWLIALCALAMGIGTAIGGRRIIGKVTQEMVSVGLQEGFASDLAGCSCLLAATLMGLPVSTTHTRTSALLGASASTGLHVNKKTVGTIISAWIITFPGCGLIGFATSKLFLFLFL